MLIRRDQTALLRLLLVSWLKMLLKHWYSEKGFNFLLVLLKLLVAHVLIVVLR